MPRKPKAPSVEKRAKTTGATGPHLSPARQALRDSLMVTRRGQGWSNAQIAAEAGVHVRTVTRVLNERDVLGDDLINREPTDTVKRMAVQFESAAADLEALAVQYVDSHPHVALGAIGRSLVARQQLLALYQATSRLPKDMGAIGDLMGMRELASQMVQVVHAFKRAEADADHIEETFKRALGLGRPRSELTQT